MPKKTNIWKIFTILIGAGFLSFLLLIAAGFYLMKNDTIEFNFLNNDTEEAMNGKVYLDGQLLGETQDGLFKILKSNITPGELTLTGNYNNKQFTIYWQLSQSDLAQKRMTMFTSNQILSEASFSAGNDLNPVTVEKEIFDKINYERSKSSLKALAWSQTLADTARYRSEDMTARQYFDHITPEGKDIGDILRERGVGYFSVGENIFTYSGVNLNTKLTDEVVQGWMESPGHRAVMMDKEVYSHAGIGVSCESNDCTITLIAAKLEYVVEDDVELDENYLTYYDLNSASMNYWKNIQTEISVESDKKITVFIMDSKEDYDNLLDDMSYDYIKKFGDVYTVDLDYSAAKDDILVLFNDNADHGANIKVKIVFKA